MDWNRIPSLHALRAFEAVARHQSYVAAARELNVTDAALRQQVRKLEAFFDTALVVRSGHSITTTQAGASLAVGLSDGFEKIQNVVEDMQSRISNRPVRVALTPAFAENWLIPRLPDFWALYPDIEIDLSPSIKSVDLSRGNHDLAIRYGHGDWPEGDARMIASADYTVVAAAGLAGFEKSDDIASLTSATWLFEDGREEHRQWANSQNIDFGAHQNRSYPNNSLVISAVRAGHGISVQSWALVEKDVQTGVLVALFRQQTPKLGYYLLHHKELSQKAKSFARWLAGLS
ncbi:MAG: LysR family transcriptional regulator [Hyphomicrobiales bacterium]|nr:LysR family transcriptional regulator [Hyphomicrobiales bacterium]PCJ93135.1 MAG: LysR family transcriptional regulator [Hyphomicrobiales bacterium]